MLLERVSWDEEIKSRLLFIPPSSNLIMSKYPACDTTRKCKFIPDGFAPREGFLKFL